MRARGAGAGAGAARAPRAQARARPQRSARGDQQPRTLAARAAANLSSSEVKSIRATYKASIDYIIRDQEVWLADPQPKRPRRRLPEQQDPEWGLDAIDQASLPLDNK